MMEINTLSTNPGYHKFFDFERFCDRQKVILKKLARELYLTNSGDSINLASSSYDYFLIKPTTIFQEMFNIDREIICVFSKYHSFEPRTLDVFDVAQSQITSKLRTETICRVLISEDHRTENRIEAYIKTNPEQSIVIPFTYDELINDYDEFFIRNKFIKHFYSRDLFSFFSPLKKEMYFFGRSQLIQDIANRHKSGEHTGLFGIRKSGKTSIIYALERVLKSSNEYFISIDCESPSIHKLKWNELLFKIIHEFKAITKAKLSITDENYIEKNASSSFEFDFKRLYNKKQLHKRVLLIFDEIERISPKTASSPHWRDGEDFIYFWQSLRGFYQRNQHALTYLLVGTNPSCVEEPILNGHENPLFGSIPSQYVPPFSVEQTREMTRKLGRYMGVKFDESIYARLNDDLGGHPYLIRKMCSDIISSCSAIRPIRIDKSVYEQQKNDFISNSSDFLEMIVQVLKEWYPDEYDMLVFLANDDHDVFKQFSDNNPSLTRHLIGYGLISRGTAGYTFNIEFLKSYLNAKHKFQRLSLSHDEMIAEISYRRNKLEKQLRFVIRNTLKLSYGKKALAKVMESLPEKRRIDGHDINSILDKDGSPLYFLDLIQIINREWEHLGKIFNMEKGKTVYILGEINELGRPDAHAKGIERDIFTQLRLHLDKIEQILSNWV